MAQKCGGRILSGHAAAIVSDPHKGYAAVFDLHGDLFRPGVYRVFHQLFDDRRRTLYHLTGGNHVRQRRRQLMNDSHI